MNLNIEEFEHECRKYAMDHAAASARGDYKAANRNYDKLVALLPKLRSIGNRGEEILRRLMEDPSDAVSMWAATHSLPVAEEDALTTLNTIAGKGGIIGFNAEMVIREWKAGRLTVR